MQRRGKCERERNLHEVLFRTVFLTFDAALIDSANANNFCSRVVEHGVGVGVVHLVFLLPSQHSSTPCRSQSNSQSSINQHPQVRARRSTFCPRNSSANGAQTSIRRMYSLPAHKSTATRMRGGVTILRLGECERSHCGLIQVRSVLGKSPSDLRKSRDTVSDPKYDGVRISRKDLLEHDDENSENQPSDDEDPPEPSSDEDEGSDDVQNAPEALKISPPSPRVSTTAPHEDDLSLSLKRVREEERNKGKAVARQQVSLDIYVHRGLSLIDIRWRSEYF